VKRIGVSEERGVIVELTQQEFSLLMKLEAVSKREHIFDRWIDWANLPVDSDISKALAAVCDWTAFRDKLNALKAHVQTLEDVVGPEKEVQDG